MSNINIKFRLQSKDKASLDPESFVVTWQLCDSLLEVYEKVEQAWFNLDHRPGKTFYLNRNSGFKQLRGRATKYRKKGVALKQLRGEAVTGYPSQRVDYKHLASLAVRLSEASQHKAAAISATTPNGVLPAASAHRAIPAVSRAGAEFK